MRECMRKLRPLFVPLLFWSNIMLVPVAQAAESPATLTWARRVELGLQTSGTVASVPAVVGKHVRKGAMLVQLDLRGYKAAVMQRQAALDSARETRDEARRELERAHELYNRTVLSDHELTLAKIGNAKADASYRAAQAALVQAQLDLEHATVRAPFDALVIARHVDVGQAVVSQLRSTPVVVVAEAGRMLARTAVGEKELSALKLGQAVTLEVDGHTFQGKVLRIGLEPVAGSSAGSGPTYPVDIEFATAGRVLRAGQSATVSLP